MTWDWPATRWGDGRTRCNNDGLCSSCPRFWASDIALACVTFQLDSPQLRQLSQAGLNKSEQHHALARVICTFKQGRIVDRSLDADEFRASGLNLVIVAIGYWNSTYLARRHRASATTITPRPSRAA